MAGLEYLPEGNGWYSKWRNSPGSMWMKPGFIRAQDDHKYNVSDYDPLRWQIQEIPPESYIEGASNYFRQASNTGSNGPVAGLGVPVRHTNDPLDRYIKTAPISTTYYAPTEFALQNVPGKKEPWSTRQTTPQIGGGSGIGGYGPGMRPTRNERVPDHFPNTTPGMNFTFGSGQYYNYINVTDLGNTGYQGMKQYKVSQGYYTYYPYMMFGTLGASGVSRAHTYRISCWIRSGEGYYPNVVIRSQYAQQPSGLVSSTIPIDLNDGDPDWVYMELEVTGNELLTSSGSQNAYYIGNYDNYTYSGGGSGTRHILISGLTLENLSLDGVSTISSWQPVAGSAQRSDSIGTSQECFPVLFWNYGCWGGGGTGNTDHMWAAMRDRTTAGYDCTGYGSGVSKTYDYMDRSYAGYTDPRVLTRPFGASFYYNRWQENHPFCPGMGWYWTFKANCGQSVGYGYYDWTDITDKKQWELVLPSQFDPTLDKEYTFIRRAYPPAPTNGWADVSAGAWRSMELESEPTIIDSKFTIEVSSDWVGYGNSGGPAGCYNFAPPPPIPSGKFCLYVVDWNDHDLIWNGTTGIDGTKIMDIHANWDGVQNGSWTLDSVTFSAGVHNAYTLDTAADLGMPVSRTIWGATMDIKPTDFPSGKVAFYLTEEWGESLTQPWFITHWSVYDSGGPISGGFGSTSDTTGNHYSNSLSVAIQPYLQVQLPRWRFGIPYGELPEDEGEDPPMRMFQRDDGSGSYQGHPRIRSLEGNTFSSAKGVRNPGENNSYR